MENLQERKLRVRKILEALPLVVDSEVHHTDPGPRNLMAQLRTAADSPWLSAHFISVSAVQIYLAQDCGVDTFQPCKGL